jgi:hypothetical protein
MKPKHRQDHHGAYFPKWREKKMTTTQIERRNGRSKNLTVRAAVTGILVFGALAVDPAAASAMPADRRLAPASTGATTMASRANCASYAYVTGDWVRIRTTPGGDRIAWAFRNDSISWPDAHSGGWAHITDYTQNATGWISQDWIDYYQPTC